jgi:hypothetical protein
MPSTYDKIATHTLASATNSYTFSSIPSTYTDLILIVDGEVSVAAACYLQYNSDTATNYSFTYLYGSGTTASSGRSSSVAQIFAGDLTTTRGTTITQIQNYSNATTYKTSLSRDSAAGIAAAATVGLWRSTSAINAIKVYADASRTFSIGSTFTLYGIKAA